jgi:hypothetical protein
MGDRREGKGHLEDVSVDGSKILKWIIKKTRRLKHETLNREIDVSTYET